MNASSFDCEEECSWRNSLLSQHSNIPSYAYWREMDIAKASLDERIQWWKDTARTYPSGNNREMSDEALRRLQLIKSSH